MTVELVNGEHWPERIAPVLYLPGHEPATTYYVPKEVLIRDTVHFDKFGYTPVEPPKVSPEGPDLTIIQGGMAAGHETTSDSTLISEAVMRQSDRLRDLGGTAVAEVQTKERYVEVSGGKKLRIVRYFDGDPRYAALTEKVVEGRKREYQAHGLLKSSAKRDEILGSNVEVVVLVDPETGEPAASLRKIHVTADNITELPSYKKFIADNAFTPEGLKLLHELSAGRNVVEIAALWKDGEYDSDTKVALYRAALQDSIRNDEVWFMGIVTPEYAGLRRTYGDRVIRTLGNAIPVKEEDAEATVRIRPILVDPHTFYGDLMDDVNAATEQGDEMTKFLRLQMLWDFLQDMDWDKLDANTRYRLEEMIK